YGADVVIVADRFSSDPETYSIKLPTHQLLWKTIIDEIKRSAQDYHSQVARKYLLRAQRCGVEIQDDKLRTFYTQLVRHYLGEAVLKDVYLQQLEKEGFDLKIWPWARLQRNITEAPAYWPESPVHHLFAGAIDDGEELNKLYNAGKIFLHISGLGYPDNYLLNGIAAGAFFLVKSHPNHRRKDGLSQYFKLNHDLITFDTPQDLCRKVDYYLQHEDERKQITETARQKLLENHSWKARAREMLTTLHTQLSP
ncbi:MAG: glycosyltransferase family 1 protein, partial [Sedimentisphaerales bacterium]|nr:glycosyltransferase family 1 protein [Sedimentisphaerales bacterium]